MGKKKSVVFMTLITIVILVLCAVVAFPVFPVPGSGGIKKWNPAALQYDLGTEFGGGHYAYYYPEGVITETEYKNNLGAYVENSDEWKEYKDSYKQYGSLYLSVDEEDGIFTAENKEEVTDEFKAAFKQALSIVTARFEARAQKTDSDFRISVIDDYAIRVQLSATEDTEGQTSSSYALQTFMRYAALGDLSFEIVTSEGSEKVSQLSDETSVKDLVKSLTVKTQYKTAFLHVKFTSLGKEMLKEFKSTDGATSLDLKLGDTTLMQITTSSDSSHINSKNEVEYPIANQSDKLYADTMCVLINSAMEQGGVNIEGIGDGIAFRFNAPTQSSEVYTYEPVYGDTLIWVYVAVLALLLALIVLAIVKMGGFGVMNGYTSVAYLAVVAFCFAFITKGVFAVSLASVFVALIGLVLVNVLNGYIYRAIKAEASLGKTIQSSVKGGYKKTLWGVIDIYAVGVLGAIALLIGAGALHTVACQALICLLMGAFCNLLFGRAVNVMLLSASKDKYKYFRFVREEDDDDE